jgi:AbrB family looped-hinge helix DNA binding protein
VTTTIDAKGRVTIPAEVRRALCMSEGDTLFLSTEGGVVRLARAANPFDTEAVSRPRRRGDSAV